MTDALQLLAIVGDDATLEAVRLALAQSHDRLSFARSFEDGMHQAQAEVPDVVFVDVSLEGRAGVALVHHLRASAPRTRVVALVPRDSFELGAEALSLGASSLVILPPSGDELLVAVADARARRAESDARGALEAELVTSRRLLALASTLAELGGAATRRDLCEGTQQALVDHLGATCVAIFASAGDRARDLVCVTSLGFDGAPRLSDEVQIMHLARERGLRATRLEVAGEVVGVIVADPGAWSDQARSAEQLVRAMTATALARLSSRERVQSGAMKDPGSSAYTFAYFVDIAGREIDKARRHSRRFSLMTLTLEDETDVEAQSVELTERVLATVRATDVLARVDAGEFYLLLPETGGIGTQTCRRRLGRKLAAGPGGRRGEGRAVAVTLGMATYPHDGTDLSTLLRVAKRRSAAASRSLMRNIETAHRRPDEVLEALFWSVAELGQGDPLDAPRSFELPVMDVVGLAATVATEAARGGGAQVVATSGGGLSLLAAVRAALGPEPGDLSFVPLDAERLGAVGLEALSVVAEHGCYALLGRRERGIVRAVHAADPMLSDLVLQLTETKGARA